MIKKAHIKVIKTNIAVVLSEKLDLNTAKKVEGNNKDRSRTSVIEEKCVEKKNQESEKLVC